MSRSYRRVDPLPLAGPYEAAAQRILDRAFAPYAVSLDFDSKRRWSVFVSAASVDRRLASGATIVWGKETIDEAVREALELWSEARAWVVDRVNRVEDACSTRASGTSGSGEERH